MVGRALALVGAVLAAVGLWYGWENLGLIRRTWFWDLRYVAFAAAAFLWLSLMESLVGRLRRLLGVTD